jgi:hypothetical protein
MVNAFFEMGAVILAIWTGFLVARTRWRVRSTRTTNSSVDQSYYALTVRTLVFSVLLTLAFVFVLHSIYFSFLISPRFFQIGSNIRSH